MTVEDGELAERWLSVELNRVWLLAERTLRAMQRAQIRPASSHPSIAEVEGALTARRVARLGSAGAAQPEDEAALSAALARTEQELVALRKAAPIGRLVDHLALRPLEVEVLVIAMAPHVDGALAEIFSVLRGPGGGRRGVDLTLVAQLCRLKRADRVALLDAVDPDRPLVRWQLIEVLSAEALESFGSLTHRAIRPSFDVLSGLCGRGQLAPELSRCVTILQGTPTLDDLQLEERQREEITTLCQAMRAHAEQPRAVRPPWLLLWGATGVGKKTVAAKLAAYAGRPLVVFNPAVLDRGTFDDLFRRAEREAIIRGAVLYIGPLVPELLAEGGRELLRRLFDYQGPLVMGVDTMEPPRLKAQHPVQEVALRIPPEPVRARLWDSVLPVARRAPDVQLGQLAMAFNLTPGEIVHTAAEALAIADRDGGREVQHAELRSGVERRLRDELGELARRLTVSVTWRDLVLPPQDMERVSEFISRKKFGDQVYNAWGFGERAGHGKGMIGLFSGPPGTGKTMLAGLIAQALGLDLYQVDLAQVVSKWVGETEKQLGKVFDHAERAHAVLLFDEADSLFAKRTEVKSSNDRYGNLAVNYLLQRLEQYSGVAILTTNKEASLDEAVQRRLSLHLHLDIPEVAERERLWQSFMPARAPIEDDIDFNLLARSFELSGGYIKNAAVRAAFLAAAQDVPIDMNLLRRASALELEDQGRLVWRSRQELAAEQAERDEVVVYDFADG